MAFPLAALTAVPQIALGAYEAFQSAKALKNLKGQPMPSYSMAPEQQSYYNRINEASQYGWDPTQIAAQKQQAAQQQNTAFQGGVQMSGGNLAQALRSGLQSSNIAGTNQFMAQGAQLQQSKLGMLGAAAGDMQAQQNLINQQKIQQRTALEGAYGGALKAGLGNITSGLMSGLGLGFMGGMGGQKTSGTPAQGQSNPAASYNAQQPQFNMSGSNFQSSTPQFNPGGAQYNFNGNNPSLNWGNF